MYGTLPAAEGQCQPSSGRAKPLWGSLVVSGLALVVVCVVLTLDVSTRPVVLQSDDLIGADQAGLLGRLQKSKENTIGDLAMVTHGIPASTPNLEAKALAFKQRAMKLQQAKKRLEEQEQRIDQMSKADEAAYAKAVHQAEVAKRSSKKQASPKKQQHQSAAAQPNTQEVAKEVASMVLETIEPQLNAEQQKIAKLSAAKDKQAKAEVSAAPKHKAVAKPAVHVKQPAAKKAEVYQPAFPAHFHHIKAPAPSKAATKKDSFQSALKKFLGQTGVNNVVNGQQKSMVDYKMDNEHEDPGAGAEPEEEPEWSHPEAKGGPCSVAGKCDHGRFYLQDPEHWRAHQLERWKEGEDGNGRKLEGGDDEEGEEEEGDENEEEDEEEVHLGNEVLLRSLDDYVTPNDAYIHNLLTSGAYGIDHFGKLAPMSKENQVLMYGASMPESYQEVLGKRLNSPGKGGAHTDEYDERRSPLGDDQIGDDDKEIPVGLTMPAFPTEDYDHFDHWKHDSPQNMELLNGAYWKRLKKDGMMDRIMPDREAYAHQIGDSHDRHPIPDLVFGDWNNGFNYGPSAKHPQPFAHAREAVHGEDWREHVFTGTHENVEDQKGVVGNMIHTGAYFKPHPAAPAPMLQQPHKADH